MRHNIRFYIYFTPDIVTLKMINYSTVTMSIFLVSFVLFFYLNSQDINVENNVVFSHTYSYFYSIFCLLFIINVYTNGWWNK